jgi:hypothetical protein
MKNNLLVLAGAIAGGVLGYLGSLLMAHWGFFAVIMPGALVGLGAGMFRCRSVVLAVACGLLALLFGLVTLWRIYSVFSDDRVGVFLSHIHQFSPVTYVLLAVGTAIGFWVPFRRIQKGGGG